MTFTIPTSHKPKLWVTLTQAAVTSAAARHGRNVNLDEVILEIQRIAPSIDFDSYGLMPSGYSQGKRAVSLALGLLKDQGLVTAPSKNRFNVPDAGTPLSTVFQTETEPEEEKTEPQVVASTGIPTVSEGVSLLPVGASVEIPDPYLGDTYLRRVAAQSTPCFGGWIMKHAACGACGLASRCKEAAIAELAKIARDMEIADARPPASAEKPKVVAPVVVAPPVELPGNIMTMPIASVCSDCGKDVPAGSQARVIKHRGTFHVGCKP